MHRLTKRENVQVIAALRFWGRAAEMLSAGDGPSSHPSSHPMCAARFSQAKVLPMTLDELETLIGQMDGSLKQGCRPWNPRKYL